MNVKAGCDDSVICSAYGIQWKRISKAEDINREIRS